MTRTLKLLSLVIAVAVMVAGCSKSGKPEEAGSTESAIDTSALASQFEGAEGALKSAVESVVAAVNSGKFAEALSSLQKLAADPSLTPRQQATINSLLEQVKAKVGGAARAAGEAAKGAAAEVNKGLGQ